MFNKEKFKELVKEQGRRTDWLAMKCGIDTEAIRKYLRGDRAPKMPVIILLSQCLGVELSSLLIKNDQKDQKAA